MNLLIQFGLNLDRLEQMPGDFCITQIKFVIL